MINLTKKGISVKPKFGIFGFSKDIDTIVDIGFDCIEMHMHEIMSMSASEFKKTSRRLHDSSLNCEVLDNPIPLDKVISDESFDLDFYEHYLNVGADRAHELGVKYYIFGNGRSRSLSTSGDVDASREKNLRFMRLLARITAEREITVLIEPLAPEVSNVVHSIPEAVEYAKKIGEPNIGTLIDYRWFVTMNHPYEHIEAYATHIQHVHIDNPDFPFPRRFVPRSDDGHDYSGFFEALRKINYEKIISIEANRFREYKEDLRAGLKFLKEMS